MGYSHGWVWDKTPTKDELDHFIKEARVVVEYGFICNDLTGWDGKGAPDFDQKELRFNCIEGSETFVFPGRITGGTNACKTNRGAHDPYVTACLILARDHWLPNDLDIFSDGIPSDWFDGEEIYRELFGRRPFWDLINKRDRWGGPIIPKDGDSFDWELRHYMLTHPDDGGT